MLMLKLKLRGCPRDSVLSMKDFWWLVTKRDSSPKNINYLIIYPTSFCLKYAFDFYVHFFVIQNGFVSIQRS